MIQKEFFGTPSKNDICIADIYFECNDYCGGINLLPNGKTLILSLNSIEEIDKIIQLLNNLKEVLKEN